MQKNKGFIKEFTNGKVPASLSHSFSGAPSPKYIYEGEAKPLKAQKRCSAGIAVQRSRNPMPNQGQFVRQTAAVLMAFGLIVGLLPGFVAAQDLSIREARCVCPSHAEPPARFTITPADVPNSGILFVDHQREGRSGHGGQAITECTNGDIIAFYSNVCGETYGGHGTAGWREVQPTSEEIPRAAQASKQETADQAAGRLLYNGIRLPETWPPDHLDPKSADPMPVPYLDHPPEVVPIDVGRQLFVDDFLIEETDLERTYHAAERYQGNPVYKPEGHDELNRRGVVYLGKGGVFFDPEHRLFKMFYTAGWRGPLAMATSPDLMNWTRPELSERGNVLIDRSIDDNALWLDLRPSHAHERVKYMECHRGGHPHAGYQFLYTSADGRDWSEGVSAGRHRGDYSSLFYNPFRDVWVFSMRATDGMGRATYYCESPEFLEADWDRDAVYWQGADRLDEPEPEGSYHPTAHAHGVQLYSRPAVAYESLIIGMHQIHRGPHNRVCEEERFPKLTDLEVGFSRDGFHWHRPSRAPFLAGTRREGDWDRAYLHSTTGVFVVLGEKLVFPYTGYSGIGPDGSRGIYHGGSIGLAFLRRDGFASMDAGPSGGTLTTRPVTFNGTHLFVNAKVPDGTVRAEVLDQNGQPIEPFTLANSVPLTGDSTLAPMAWEGGSDLASLRGKPVRFRFELAGGSLYAFWVSLDESGRSDGFVAAGGPGYTGPTDTVGRAALVDSTKAKNR